MKTLMKVVVLTALLVPGPAGRAQTAPDGARVPPVFEAVRTGDETMDCDALNAEMLQLATTLQALQSEVNTARAELEAQSMARVPRGGAMNLGNQLLGIASAFVPGAALVAGAVSMAQAPAANMAAITQHRQVLQQSEAVQAQALKMTPLAERMGHLAQLSSERGC